MIKIKIPKKITINECITKMLVQYTLPTLTKISLLLPSLFFLTISHLCVVEQIQM